MINLRFSRLSVSLVGLFLAAGTAAVAKDYKRLDDVYRGGTTVVGEAVIYPEGEAEVRSVVVTLMPGEETGWHTHAVPLFGYILEGTVKVDYGDRGTRTFTRGEGFMEAMATGHNGRNTGTEPCRILAVFIGSKGMALNHPAPASRP